MATAIILLIIECLTIIHYTILRSKLLNNLIRTNNKSPLQLVQAHFRLQHSNPRPSSKMMKQRRDAWTAKHDVAQP